MECKICQSRFSAKEDIIYLCDHKKGFVHLNCCVNSCSWNHAPCAHKVAAFMNLDKSH